MPDDPAETAPEQPTAADPAAEATGVEPAGTPDAADTTADVTADLTPDLTAGAASGADPVTADGPVETSTDDGPPTEDAAPAQAAAPAPAPAQSSLAAPAAAARGLSYAVDIVFCIDVTGSMTPIIDAVKANALRFYDDVQTNLTAKGKIVDELRVRVVAFRDVVADGEAAMAESPFFALPAEQAAFSDFVGGLRAEGGGDEPESGLEAVSLAINSEWTTRGDRRRQVIVVWTDQPAHPLDPTVVPPSEQSRVPGDFSALTDLWEDAQGPLGSSSKRLILFAPDGPGWSDISAVWENVVHHPSQAGGGLSDVDYGTIVDSIGNSV